MQPAPQASKLERLGSSRTTTTAAPMRATAVVVDIVDSMTLSSAMTTEAWWDIMERVYSILSDGVVEFGGWVDSFTGDGVAAVFDSCGIERDGAKRACLAALGLRAQLETYGRAVRDQRGVHVPVRIGVNSGDIVVGRVARAKSRPTVTVGHSIGLAKRIESLASPGSVYISSSTAGLIYGAFHTQPRGTFEIRGATEPIELYELIAHYSEIRYEPTQRIPRDAAVVLA